MKKLWTAVFSAMLVVSITACGNNEEAATTETPAATDTTAPAETATETPAAETAETPAAEEPTGEASSMSAEELLNKAQEATKELKSYNMVANIDQDMMLNGEENTSKTMLNTDIILDPVSAYQEITMEVSGEKNEVKQYMTADAIYVGTNDQWMKLPEEQRSQAMASIENAANLESSFDQFKSIAKEMTVTEEGDDYVLSATLSGDEVKSMAQEVMGQSGTDENTAAILEQMNIEEMKMTYAINKETSYPTKSIVDMTMSMQGGEGDQAMDMSMHMIMDSTISKHNEIKEITVPQDVIDGAQ